MTELTWVRRTCLRPFLCDNCDDQVWPGTLVYLMVTGEKYCPECPPDDVEDDGSVRVWCR